MNRLLRLLIAIVFLALIAGAGFWWYRPRPVDIAAYVPADSLVYVESDSVADIARAISETDAWRSLAPALSAKSTRPEHQWLAYLSRLTGIGSTQNVIALRAQAAFVMLDLNANGEGDTLELKPLAALVVETHTSESRIRPVIESLIGDFAKRAYDNPRVERITVDKNEFVKWTAPDGKRRIVLSIDGTAAVVGNEEQAVSACLAAIHGQRPNLSNQPELQQMRARLSAGDALAFGYVSAGHAAQLVSVAAPLIFGKIPTQFQLEKLLAASAAKTVGSVAWSAHSFAGGIEDRYLLSLKPDVVSHLRLGFATTGEQHEAWDLLPAGTYSLTCYNLRNPAAAWDALNAAASSQLDALGAFIVTGGFKAALVPYGIDEPDSFLGAIKPEVLTVRLDSNSDRSLVIARIRDRDALQQFVARRFGSAMRTEQIAADQLLLSPDGQAAASFHGDYFLLGTPDDIRRCLSAQAKRATINSSAEALKLVTHFADTASGANVVTYTQDHDRVSAMISALAGFRAARTTNEAAAAAEGAIKNLPYAVTETTLVDSGFERRTRSPFGQFGTILSLLQPQPRQTPEVAH
jgi:hypothetical protein